MRATFLVIAVFGVMLCIMAAIAERSTPIGMALIGAGVLGGSIVHMRDIAGHHPVRAGRIGVEALIASLALMMLVAGVLRA